MRVVLRTNQESDEKYHEYDKENVGHGRIDQAGVATLGACARGLQYLWVCLSVCLSATSHLWSVCSFWNRCHVLNGQRRSKYLWDFLWNCFVAEIQHSIRCTAYSTAAIFPAHALTNEACQLACVREFDVNVQLASRSHAFSAGLDVNATWCNYAMPNQLANL